MDNGCILLSRSILESDVFASQKLLKIWIWCLCKANYKDKSTPLKIGKGETIVNVKRGSFIFGRMKAEDQLFIDGSTIYKSMQKLQELEMIQIKSNNQYSIVTICNYDKYQTLVNYQVTAKEQPSNNQVTANEQPSNTTKKDKKDNNNNIYAHKKFYTKELQNTNCDSDIMKLYAKFIDILYGKNDLNRELTELLNLENQVSYIQFSKLLKKSKDKNKKFSTILPMMTNDPKYYSKKKSLYLCLNTWLNSDYK